MNMTVLEERLYQDQMQLLTDNELFYLLLTKCQKIFVASNQGQLESIQKLFMHYKTLYELKNASYLELSNDLGEDLASIFYLLKHLGLRFFQSKCIRGMKITSSQQVGQFLMRELHGLDQERLYVIYLNTQHEILKTKVVFIGSVNQSLAHPREIFKEAIKISAVKIILAHNHPSGDLTLSKHDKQFIQRMFSCGELLGIDILDHFLISDTEYMSFKEEMIDIDLLS